MLAALRNGVVVREAEEVETHPAEMEAPDFSQRGFAVYLAQRSVPDGGENGGEGPLHRDDLALAYACLTGVAEAEHSFETVLQEVVARSGKRFAAAADEQDELCQRVRERLLVGSQSKPPYLERYNGRGPLKTWLRTVVVRCWLDLKRQDQALEQRRWEVVAFDRITQDATTFEWSFLRGQYLGAFQRAFRDALQTLSPHERLVLRLHLASGLNLAKVASRFGVHRATALRWLAKTKQRLLVETRCRLQQSLGVESAEVESIIRLLGSSIGESEWSSEL